MKILLPFATSYLTETASSAVAAIRTKYRSVMNLENDLTAAVSKLQPRYENLSDKGQTHPCR
jgi:hypothetical protein